MKARNGTVNRYTVAGDDWTRTGPVVTSTENDEAIRVLLDRGPIIVEHKFYRGGSSPHRLVFDDYEDYKAYLGETGRAGDVLTIWGWEDVCTDEAKAVYGKCSDDDGYTPTKGPY